MAEVDRNIPEVGMRFKTPDEGWLFWVAYGGRSGFDVRKRGSNVSKMDGKVTSCRYVCSNEGVRTKKQTEDVRKCFRAETRTGCKAQMVIVLDRGAGNYEVTDIVLEHNHPLHIPETFHLMRSQRRISELQAFEIETADDSGIRPKVAHELATRQVGGPLNLSYTCRDRKNYLQSKRQRELASGQAGSMLKYFHDKIVENPSFQYALQPDCEDHITNIFWADAKMVLDYAHFGDVVTFDTTFGTNKEYRPFGVFLGLNQFIETIIFGAALLFDETEASFTWLFDTFLAAHNGKQPRTIYTDQDAAMAKAFKIVFTESYHGLCTFHIMQNAVKHLSPIKGEEEDEAEEKEEGAEKEEGDEESHSLYDFSACMFEARKKLPRRLMCTPMLVQASEVYTPAIFEAFQGEYERSMAACARVLDGEHKYAVAVGNLLGELSYEKEYIVIGDLINQNATCSCRMFERTGILCAHGLKVLDLRRRRFSQTSQRELKLGLISYARGSTRILNLQKKGVKQQKKNDGSQPHVEVKDDGSHKEINVEVEKYNIISQVEVEQYNMISNFTQLVAAPTYDDDILRDQDLF